MYINRYGNSEGPVIVLLPPMMVTGEDLYNAMAPYFKGDYCIIAPDHGSHGKAEDYLSADLEYKDLKSYLIQNGYRHIHLLFGASLGANLAYRLFCDPDIKEDHVWLDGLLLKKSAPIVEKMMKDTFLKLQKDPDFQTGRIPKDLTDLIGQDFASLILENYKQLTRADIQKICHAYCRMEPEPVSAARQEKVHLEYGEDDFALNPSKSGLKKYLPLVNPVVRMGCKHCEYLAVHMAAYVEEMESFSKR